MSHEHGLPHGSRPTHVYERLREQIQRGGLPPGLRIVEADIAQSLGVSRTPVRSALRTLMRDGYVVASGRGRQVRLRVAPIGAGDLVEIFQLLGVLEGVAARNAAALPAAERRVLAQALRHDTRALEAAFRELPPDYDRRLALHRQFHVRLTGAGAGLKLRALLDAVRPLAERYEWIYGRVLPRGIVPAAREHDAIARAIQEGNAEAARQAVEANWANAASRLAPAIDTAEASAAVPAPMPGSTQARSRPFRKRRRR
jgi:DNA-binding GntR family transcriptional regulator